MPVSKVVGLKWEIRGQEHLSEPKACIIVSNHQSALDILGQFHMWPIMKRCTVIAKRELFWIWPFGLAAWLSGLIFIDRKHPDKAKQQMLDCTDDLKKSNTKLWIFPEGTRHNTGEIHDFKKGAFHVAVQSQLPIMPVVYSSYKSFLSDKKKVLDPGHIIVEALPTISTVGLGPKDVGDLMEKVRNMMVETFKANTKEVESTSEFLARVAKLTPENDLLSLKETVSVANGDGGGGGGGKGFGDEVTFKRQKNGKDTVKVPQ